MRIIQPGFGDIDYRHRNAAAGAWATIGLFDIGTTGFIEFLQLPGVVRQSDFGKLRVDHATTAFEYAENIGRRNRFPGRQRRQARQDSHRGHFRRDRDRTFTKCRLAVGRVGFPEDIAFERQDTVVVRRSAPEHRAARHQAAFAGLDNRQVAGTASQSCDAQIAGIDETYKLRCFAIQQRVGARWISGRRIFPFDRIARWNMRLRHRQTIFVRVRAGIVRVVGFCDAGIAAMAIGAAKNHGRVAVHRAVVATGVAARATGRFFLRQFQCLFFRRGGLCNVVVRYWFGFFGRNHHHGRDDGHHGDENENKADENGAHQKLISRLNSTEYCVLPWSASNNCL